MPTQPPVNILLVDDQPENLVALEAILGDLGANLVKSTSGQEALRCLLQDDFALILLDVQMPQMDGFEVATLIRQRQRSQDTPIIFLTAFSSSEQFMFKGYALGAVDYLIKPIAPNILLSKVAIFIELFKKTEALRQKTETLQRQATQLEAINTELQTSEERFRLLSTCSPVGVFVTDTEGRCVYTNPRFQVICEGSPEPSPATSSPAAIELNNGVTSGQKTNQGLDQSPNQKTGQSWLDSVHPDDLAVARSTWTAYLQNGQDYAQEFRLRPRGEIDRWAAIRSARMVSEQKNFLGYVGTVEDITERKQAEAANAQVIREQAARKEAETANRMKDDFIAVLSHELRTPLNSILGWANLLQAGKLDSQKVEYAIETIERNALAQKQLIEDILDVSQIVRGKLQLHRLPVDLVAVAQTALETVRPAATAKAIALTTNFHDCDRLEVTGDALRLQQVIWNLLTNAVKFTPEQGRVDIHLSVVASLPKAALSTGSGSDRAPAAYAQLRITDTGQGIDADFLPHIFDRFRQADSSITRSQGGLGLGLAIVHHLVEQHQGHVWAESAGLNQGAAFTVALPLAQSTAPTPPLAPDLLPDQPSAHALDGLPILIVEDDTDTRDFLAFLLEAQGALVTTTASASEGLHLIDSVRPAVLLCDISMPDMDGYTLIQKIRNQLPAPQANIPAIAITAHARLSDQAQALSNGFQSHLPKPIEAETLVRTILQVTG